MSGGGFARVPHTVGRDGSLSHIAFRLWVVLKGHGDESHPHIATLAEEMGVERRTVTRAIGELTTRRLLVVGSGKKAGAANTFTLLEPEEVGHPRPTPPDQSEPEGKTPTTYRVEHPRPTGRTPATHRVGHPRPTKEEEPKKKNQGEERAPAPSANGSAPHRAEAAALCEHLADRITQHRGNPHRRPKITAQWERDMDLLLRRGPPERAEAHPIKPDVIRRAIDFVFTECVAPRSGGTFCWANNIQSPGALRRQWDRLVDERNANRATRNGHPETDRGTYVNRGTQQEVLL